MCCHVGPVSIFRMPTHWLSIVIKLHPMSMTNQEITQAVDAIVALRPELQPSNKIPKAQSRADVKKRWDNYRYKEEIKAIENEEDVLSIPHHWTLTISRRNNIED